MQNHKEYCDVQSLSVTFNTGTPLVGKEHFNIGDAIRT